MTRRGIARRAARFPVGLEEQAERDITRAHREIDRILKDAIKDLKEIYERNGVRTDAVQDEVARWIQELSTKLTTSDLAAGAEAFWDRNIDRLVSFSTRSLKELFGDSIPRIAPSDILLARMRNRAETSAGFIRNIPQQTSRRIADKVLTGVGQGLRFEEIAKQISREGEISLNRARLVARDQTGKIYSEAQEAVQADAGITHYTWSTSLDSRVRDTHEAKEGQTFAWNSPPSDTGHPGEDINCRCVAVPLVS